MYDEVSSPRGCRGCGSEHVAPNLPYVTPPAGIDGPRQELGGVVHTSLELRHRVGVGELRHQPRTISMFSVVLALAFGDGYGPLVVITEGGRVGVEVVQPLYG